MQHKKNYLATSCTRFYDYPIISFQVAKLNKKVEMGKEIGEKHLISLILSKEIIKRAPSHTHIGRQGSKK